MSDIQISNANQDTPGAPALRSASPIGNVRDQGIAPFSHTSETFSPAGILIGEEPEG